MRRPGRICRQKMGVYVKIGAFFEKKKKKKRFQEKMQHRCKPRFAQNLIYDSKTPTGRRLSLFFKYSVVRRRFDERF